MGGALLLLLLHRLMVAPGIRLLSLAIVLGEVVRRPVERRFPRVGKRFAKLVLEMCTCFLLRFIQYQCFPKVVEILLR